MKRIVPVTVALLGGLAFFGLTSAAHGGRETLFPGLRGEDFPKEANHVRFEWLEAAEGSLLGRAFHTRPGDVVFPSLVTAAVAFDRETGGTVLKVVRLDDDCLAFADEIGASAEEGCLAVTVANIAPGVERVSLQARFFDYQVHFYLVQSRADPAEWNLAPTGRKGEPQVLRLRTREVGDSVVADWELSYRSESREVSLPLHVTLPVEPLRNAGVSTTHAALASSPELFYDMADFHVWEVMREDQLIDTGIPGPGSEDDECEVLTMCPAEYQSCTPTTGGWLACSGMGDGWGGVACEIGGCGGGGRPRGGPDWAPGSSSTSPAAALPEFSGLTEVQGGYRLKYELTSVLQDDDAAALTYNAPLTDYASHVVSFSLTSKATALEVCSDFRYVPHASFVIIPKGSKKKYKGSDSNSVCGMPAPGVYELRYHLDPRYQWSEGDESNNSGIMRGSLRVRP
jgi:hypothetical protein